MGSELQSDRLPFEPGGKRKKAEKASKQSEIKKSEIKPSKPVDSMTSKKSSGEGRDGSGIPPAVSRRMIRRVVILSGIPTFLGVAVFFISYYLLVQKIVELPTVAVFLSTLGCFGLGVLGISYGVLSASWDEEIPGTRLGWSEFTLNLGRLISARRRSRESKSKT